MKEDVMKRQLHCTTWANRCLAIWGAIWKYTMEKSHTCKCVLKCCIAGHEPAAVSLFHQQLSQHLSRWQPGQLRACVIFTKQGLPIGIYLIGKQRYCQSSLYIWHLYWELSYDFHLKFNLQILIWKVGYICHQTKGNSRQPRNFFQLRTIKLSSNT